MLLLVSHVEYIPRAILRLVKDKTDWWTDVYGRHADRYITLTAGRGQRNNARIMRTLTLWRKQDHNSDHVQNRFCSVQFSRGDVNWTLRNTATKISWLLQLDVVSSSLSHRGSSIEDVRTEGKGVLSQEG